MTVDFRELLTKPMDAVERPKPLPAGTYHGYVKGHKFDKSSQKGTPFVRFTLGVSSAGEDVDAEALEGIDLSKKELRRDYFITDDALYRLKDFLESVGISTEGRLLGECIPETTGARVLMTVKQRTSEQDANTVFNDVSELVGEAA